MKRADPVTLRKALEFAHDLAKNGVEFVVIPMTDERQRERMLDELALSLAVFESVYAEESKNSI